MDWDELRVLLAISRASTLTEAGKNLNINQTTVTRRLEALESRLGLRLVERSRRGVRLSGDAAQLVDAAQRIEDVVMTLERQMLGRESLIAGLLRVTTSDLIASHHHDLFQSFILNYPAVELEMSMTYDQRSLSRREADVAIRCTNAPDEHLHGRKLARLEYAAYVARESFEAQNGTYDLSAYPWISWSERSQAFGTERWMRRQVPDARIICRHDSAMFLMQSVQNGLGAGLIPCAYGDQSPNLVRLTPNQPELSYTCWGLIHPELKDNPRVRTFMDWAATYFEARKAQFAGVIGRFEANSKNV